MSSRSQAAAATLLAALLLAPAAARAQGWVAVGPPGGDVRSLAADPRDPDRIYLGTADGVLYRSDDGGRRWRRLDPGFPRRGYSLDDLIVAPSGAVLIGFWEVGGSGGGVARSADGGETFTLLEGMAAESVRALALAPSNPNVLVAGTMTGVFRSRDGGKSWRRISPANHPELKTVGSVAVDPDDPEVIYAGTWHLPWKTTDGGRSWFPLHAGMIDDSDVMTLTVDRRDPGSLFATACSGIYRRGGPEDRWTRVRGIPYASRRTRAFTQSPDRPERFYAGTTAGVWLTEDGAATWSRTTPEDVVANAVVALPGGLVLVGTDGAGVLRSTDAGKTWETSNAGFYERFVSQVAFDAGTGRVLAGIWGDRRHGGVFVSPGLRGPWTRIGAGLEGREVLSLAVAGSRYLAGTDDGIFSWPGAQGGWERLRTVVHAIDTHPRVNDIAVLSETVWLLASPKGLLRTEDGGRTWKRPALGPQLHVTAVARSPHEPGLVLAATPLGVFRSTDGGDRWLLAARGPGSGQTHRMAFLPTDAAVVFATSTRGLFRSDDRGDSWQQVVGGVPHTDITGLALHPDGRTMYASEFTWGGVFRSQDGGRSWQRLSADGLTTERVWTVALDPQAPERLLAASPSGGLHLWATPSGASAPAAAGAHPY